ncbi:MAG: MarR family winged helix-turn-helix transcriptional regulator [Nitrospiraceae bacterium]
MSIVHANTDSLARRVAEGLRKISTAIRSRAWKEAGKRRMTPLQAQTLAVLRMQPEQAARISILADELAVSLPTVSDMVRTLEKKGLIQKSRSQQDARIVTVRLSAKGKRIAGERQDFLADVAGRLAVSEQEAMLQVLMKMIQTLHARGDIRTARMCVTCRFFRPNAFQNPKRPHHCDFFKESFGNRLLRIECPAHEPAPKADANQKWKIFTISRM